MNIIIMKRNQLKLIQLAHPVFKLVWRIKSRMLFLKKIFLWERIMIEGKFEIVRGKKLI